jgi:hypothetical protein
VLADPAETASTRERLLAARIPLVDVTDLAERIDKLEPAARDLLLAMADAGLESQWLRQSLPATETAAALRLSARGLDPAQIGDLARGDWLQQSDSALEAGIPHDTLLRAVAIGRVVVSDLTALARDDIPESVLEQLLARADLLPSDLRILREGGCTWDDIARVTATPVPIGRVAQAHQALTTGTAAHMPARVRLLAAVLYAVVSHAPTTGLLPAAAAISGQPWEATALTLLTDQDLITADQATRLILAARVLDGDPTLPEYLAGDSLDGLIAWLEEHPSNLGAHAHDDPRSTPAGDLLAYAAAAAGQPWADDVRMTGPGPSTNLAALTLAARAAHSIQAVQAARTVTVTPKEATPAAGRNH